MKIKINVFQIISFEIRHDFICPNIINNLFQSRQNLLPYKISGEVMEQIMYERNNEVLCTIS